MVLFFDVFNPVRPNARVEMLNQRSGFMCSEKSPSQAATQPISLRSAAPAKPRVERGLTTILFVAAVFLWGIGLTALFSEKIQWTTYLFLCIPIHWLFLVAAHDALHQSAHHNSKINRLVGWLSNGFFLLAFPMIKRAHLLHHAKEGSSEDIERFGHERGWTLPIRLMLGMWCFYAFLPKCSRRVQAQSFLVLALAGLALAIRPYEVFWGWLVPMQVMSALTAICYIYLPHGPLASWVQKYIPVITGYHEDHHDAPAYPSHQIGDRKTRYALREIQAHSHNRQQSAIQKAIYQPPIAATQAPQVAAH